MTSIIGGSDTVNTLDQKFHTLTDKYKLVSTKELVSKIESLGFKMESFVANKVKKKEKQGFQKHRAIFSSTLLKATNDGVPQLLLTNSHDGSSSVTLQIGFFRIVCANGLVVGKQLVTPIKIRHTGFDIDLRLTEAVNTIVAQAELLTNSIDNMKSRRLTIAEIKAFESEAVKLRLQDNAELETVSMTVHRHEDVSPDLFTVMNVIQENLIRGGAKVLVKENGTTKNKTLRKITSIQSQTDINMKLWDIAQRMVA